MTRMTRPRRSVLYMPGSNPRAMDKARSLPTDSVILDLEDAVAPDQKDFARAQVVETVRAGGFGKREVVIRVNGLDTPHARADIAAAAQAGAHAILVPKIDSAAEVMQASGMMAEAGAPADLALWAMIETPGGIFNLREIAGAGGRLSVLVMGTNDLVKEMHGQHVPDRAPLVPLLSFAVLAARGAGLSIIDGVYNDIQNEDGFLAVCRQGRAIGFDGKTLIHPSQIRSSNMVFSPAADEVAEARKVISAFELPENKGKGAIKVDGKMVELLHAEIARRLVHLADAIAALETP